MDRDGEYTVITSWDELVAHGELGADGVLVLSPGRYMFEGFEIPADIILGLRESQIGTTPGAVNESTLELPKGDAPE